MKCKVIIAAVLCLLGGTSAKAQLLTLGSEPASVKWSVIETPTYKIIYPRGMDSLAGVYARNLQAAAAVVGNSAGFTPNQSYRRRMPVIIHPYSATSNGQVTWAPRRIDLLTVPDAYSPESTTWEKQLTVHESRHSSQMQFSNARPFRIANAVIGQFASGALSAVYPGPAFFEGDAVVAETALSGAGRGRTSDFLEYFRVSFDKGDWRDYWRWRWGSQRLYTPDYYRVGYITIAGVRTLLDEPDFTARYFQRIADKHGIAFNNFNKTVKDVSGKRFKEVFREIEDSLQKEWEENDAVREPFIDSEPVTQTPSRFTEYKGLEVVDGVIYAAKHSLTAPWSLVRISPDGSEKKICPISGTFTGIRYSASTGRIFWTEYKQDKRWELKSSSTLYYTYGDGAVYKLLNGERTKFYNPDPSPDENLLALVEYPDEGGSRVVVVDPETGERLEEYDSPAGVQVVETAWAGKELYASTVTEGGFGIMKVGSFETVLGAQQVKVNHLWGRDGMIMFTSDRNGVNELYSLDPSNGKAVQMTSNRFGGQDFRMDESGDNLYFTALQSEGRMIRKVAVSSLKPKEADFSRIHRYSMADELTAGEKAQPGSLEDIEVPAPKRYSKAGNLFRFHSWAPLYISYDSVSDMSFESVTDEASLGASAFFQNDLGNFSGSLGYKLSDNFRSSAHAHFTYTGWYPVIDLSLDLNDRNSVKYSYGQTEEDPKKFKLSILDCGSPYVSAKAKVYIPFVLSSHGISKGIIPQVTYQYSNDLGEIPPYTDGGKSVFGEMSKLTLSLRGYIIESTPESRIYPRLGAGAEAGVVERLEIKDLISPGYYGFLYGYLPGLHPTHGIKLSALYQHTEDTAPLREQLVTTIPGGFESGTNSSLATFPQQLKLSFRYALPFAPVDCSLLCPVAYIRNFELYPHADATFISRDGDTSSLTSAGADICARLSNFLWIPYDTRVGVTFDYLSGSYFDKLVNGGMDPGRYKIGMMFSVDF